ncbi:hypothetical protein ACLOJK_038245 [Asimina triloba]
MDERAHEGGKSEACPSGEARIEPDERAHEGDRSEAPIEHPLEVSEEEEGSPPSKRRRLVKESWAFDSGYGSVNKGVLEGGGGAKDGRGAIIGGNGLFSGGGPSRRNRSVAGGGSSGNGDRC